ncbi:MAG: hypothetical protein HY051_03205 [Candidatus Aenigmarchaeota archaeon]|nr:hypothetical protein [Candidatus Aenigmarchaeota archaeon]
MDIRKTAGLASFAIFFIFYSFYGSGSLEMVTDNDVYKPGETIKISGFSDAGSVTLYITGLFPLDAIKTVPVKGGSFEYDYKVMAGDYGEILVRAEAAGAEKKTQAFIQKDAADLLGVEFITPAIGERFYRGNNLTMNLRVSRDGVPLKDASVLCKLSFPGLPEAGATAELLPAGDFFADTYQITGNDVRSGGVYYRDYHIGWGDPTQTWVIKCAAEKNGERGGASRPIKVVNTPILIEFLSPPKALLENGEDIDVMVRAYYQNGDPVKNGIVLLEDSDGRQAQMEQVSDSGIFEFRKYDTASDNNYLSLSATAIDDAGNGGKNSVIFRIVKNTLPDTAYKLWWTLPMIITIILLTVYLEKQIELSYTENTSRPKILKNRIAELQDEKRDIVNTKSAIEEKYYRRKIDEGTFRRMMERYEQESTEIDVKIRRLKEELEEFD